MFILHLLYKGLFAKSKPISKTRNDGRNKEER